MKININKGFILMLLLPAFILIMFILEIIYAKEIFDKFLTLGVIAFLFRLGLKIGSIDEKVKGVSNRLYDVEKLKRTNSFNRWWRFNKVNIYS
ncbi:hypothetical protein ES695_11370 [Candidatus Atribacteria bacterium 1244-E10-H5-B2]|nr:MAG: hypothetical protein ES695_11370 [Candidatus Atribacteria bacterium 1244-E10-H5-B2]